MICCAQVFHTALEVVCDGLHVLIEDPYGPNIGVQYRLPHSNEYHKVCLGALEMDVRLEMPFAKAQGMFVPWAAACFHTLSSRCTLRSAHGDPEKQLTDF